jgi:hypothetical protein
MLRKKIVFGTKKNIFPQQSNDKKEKLKVIIQ